MFSYAKIALVASILSSTLAAPAPKDTYHKGGILVEFSNAPVSLSTCLVGMDSERPHWNNKKNLCPPQYIRLVDESAPEKGFFLYDEIEGQSQPGQMCSPGNAASDSYAYCGRNVSSIPDDMNKFYFTEQTINKADGQVPKSGVIGTSDGNTAWWRYYHMNQQPLFSEKQTHVHDLNVEFHWSIWED